MDTITRHNRLTAGVNVLGTHLKPKYWHSYTVMHLPLTLCSSLFLEDEDDGGLNGAAIAGIVIGVLAALVLAVVAVIYGPQFYQGRQGNVNPQLLLISHP